MNKSIFAIMLSMCILGACTTPNGIGEEEMPTVPTSMQHEENKIAVTEILDETATLFMPEPTETASKAMATMNPTESVVPIITEPQSSDAERIESPIEGLKETEPTTSTTNEKDTDTWELPEE